MRDSQKSRVFWAEAVLNDKSKRFETVEECRVYLNKIWVSKWARKKFQNIVLYRGLPKIYDGRGTRIARGGLSDFNFPRWARKESTLLHELAHALAPIEEKHGRKFAEILLMLVGRWMGKECHDLLKASFKEKGVKFRPKRKLSPETLEKLRARGRLLAAAKNPLKCT